MACWDQADATAILALILNDTAYSAIAALKIKLGTNIPTATSDMSELAGGSGYTTGGSSITWSTVSAAASSNSNTVAWTNSGSTWSIEGLEIWDTSGTRHFWGQWSGSLPINVSSGNTFQAAAAGIAISLVLSLFQ